jgi:uncharacterized protein (TIGR03382 family)
MIFPPVLLFSSYLNLSGYEVDAAGITAAWSALYGLLALRRRQVLALFLFLFFSDPIVLFANNGMQGLKNKFTLRGGVRGASIALCAVNVTGGGLAYVFGKREKEEA